MKRMFVPVLSTLLALGAIGTAQAHDKRHLECDLHSDYRLQMHRKAFVFTREDGPASHVAIGGGRLFVDGQEVSLDAADRERVRSIEAGLNRMVPQMQQVVVEATDIAFAALVEVAHGFAPTGGRDDGVAELLAAQRHIQAELKREPLMLFGDEVEAKVISPVVTKFVPVLAGNAVRSTLAAVFSGDEDQQHAFEQRMDAMGDEIERKVEARADGLEPKVEALCAGARELDRLEQGLTVRPGGEPLDLLRTSH
jgi:hypothetical protein